MHIKWSKGPPVVNGTLRDDPRPPRKNVRSVKRRLTLVRSALNYKRRSLESLITRKDQVSTVSVVIG